MKLKERPIKAQTGKKLPTIDFVPSFNPADYSLDKYYKTVLDSKKDPMNALSIAQNDDNTAKEEIYKYFDSFIDSNDPEGLLIALNNYNDDIVNNYVNNNKDKLKGNFGTIYQSYLKNKGNIYSSEKNGNNTLENIGRVAKPAIGAATLLMNLKKLKDTKDAAYHSVVSPNIPIPRYSIRPIQQLSPEIINLYREGIGNIGTRNTSDPIANIIAQDLVNKQKIGAINKLAAQQAQNLEKERNRYDQTKLVADREANKAIRDNAIAAAKAVNTEAAARANINSQYEKAIQNTLNRFFSQLHEGLHQRAVFNTASDREKFQNAKNAILTDINTLKALYYNTPMQDVNTRNNLMLKINDKLEEYRNLGNFETGSYGDVMGRALSGKCGTKLKPRKNYGKKKIKS
jgi:hypothetical protein